MPLSPLTTTILISLASPPPPRLVISRPGTLLLDLLLLGLKQNINCRERTVGLPDRAYSFILRILTLVLRPSILVLTVFLRTIIFVIELLYVIFLLRGIV